MTLHKQQFKKKDLLHKTRLLVALVAVIRGFTFILMIGCLFATFIIWYCLVFQLNSFSGEYNYVFGGSLSLINPSSYQYVSQIVLVRCVFSYFMFCSCFSTYIRGVRLQFRRLTEFSILQSLVFFSM